MTAPVPALFNLHRLAVTRVRVKPINSCFFDFYELTEISQPILDALLNAPDWRPDTIGATEVVHLTHADELENEIFLTLSDLVAAKVDPSTGVWTFPSGLEVQFLIEQAFGQVTG